MTRLLVAGLIAAALVGCTKTVYVDRNTISYVGMDDSWLVSCPLWEPPNKEVYSASSSREKLDMWSAGYVDQARVTSQRNLVMDEAREYNRKKLETTIVLCDGKPCDK